MKLNNTEKEMIRCILENEIESNKDMMTMTKGKERIFWIQEVKALDKLKEKF